MDEQQYKTRLKQTFDTVASGYDSEALRFFRLSADVMTSLLQLRGNERVLDLGCGTGHASIAVAKRLTSGRVTAVDFSTKMLDEARAKAASCKLDNIDFVERDIQNLRSMAGQFDVAVCAFSIFFVDDMKRQLEGVAATVKTGGTVMISTFREGFLSPLKELFFDHIKTYGARIPPMTWKRICTEERCRALFEQAGLGQIRVTQTNMGYFLQDEKQWWDVVWNAGMRRAVTQLNPEDAARFKSEHLQEVRALQTKDGIWLEVGVLYASGVRG